MTTFTHSFISSRGAVSSSLITGLLIGATFSAIVSAVLFFTLNVQSPANSDDATSSKDENKPLYWVAPMDDNFRRDKPGKSPMGMDLVPVYANDNEDEVGTVSITPQVVNNLGVRTAKVEYRPLVQSINTVGYIQYDQDQLVHIHPRVEGWVDKLFVNAAGETVQQGDPLYQLYSPQLVNAQEEYLLALNRNSKELKAASKARLAALALPSSFIDELTRTRKVKQSVTFYAPQTGVIANLNIVEGFFVKPGSTLMSIGSLDKVWVEVEIFERQAAQVAVAQPVTMTLDYIPEKTWQGTVDYVYPTVDANTRTARARLVFDNHGQLLKPNMFAQVTIQSQQQQPRLLVPRQAVIRTGQQNRIVLALGDGKFKSVAVQLGESNADYIAVTQGLKQDDEVVISAQFLIDSESSKTSDFMRMDMESSHTMEAALPTATVNGTINHINYDDRSININREAIKKWQRPATTMDFLIDENIDITAFKPDQAIHFTFVIKNGEFIITALSAIDEHQHHGAVN
ncbi:efflux RND transporter periplasmic adaptor subunit [Flocculibacter collagenilyticus]|uniref:efflux RND transporter periplasmic adaptor subunit n=1 Tax=Flocculibacter collagenilyticus TaxID=2744479 RepID=UPI0018F72018|nr:efflux RND transporter periplasmic adaptor subunit [Flocculibacter collagenilyticus]